MDFKHKFVQMASISIPSQPLDLGVVLIGRSN